MEVVSRQILQVQCEADGTLFVITNICPGREGSLQCCIEYTSSKLTRIQTQCIVGIFQLSYISERQDSGERRGSFTIVLKQTVEENSLQYVGRRDPEEEMGSQG